MKLFPKANFGVLIALLATIAKNLSPYSKYFIVYTLPIKVLSRFGRKDATTIKARLYIRANRFSEDPRYDDSICYQRCCCIIEFAVLKKLDRTHLKDQYRILLSTFFYKPYALCICQHRLGEAILTNTHNVCFPVE